LKIAAARGQHDFVHLYFPAFGGNGGVHEHLAVQQARHDVHQVWLVVVPPQTEPLIGHRSNLQIRRTRYGQTAEQTKQTNARDNNNDDNMLYAIWWSSVVLLDISGGLLSRAGSW